MEERHDREQYFFDESTRARLVRVASGFERPCCLSMPTVGRDLAALGRPVTILDLDERFADTPGFRRFDLRRPEWLGLEFGLILCDPPFFTVSLSELLTALRMLSRYRDDQPTLVTSLVRRRPTVERALSRFGLKATGWVAGYETVTPGPKNDIEFLANFAVAD
jgi:hypothetical protein